MHGHRWHGKLVSGAMYDRGVNSAIAERPQSGAGRCRHREQTVRAEPSQHRLGDAERRIASGDHRPGRAGAGELPKPSGLDHAIWLGPRRSGDPVVGKLGGNQPLANPSQFQCCAVVEIVRGRGDDLGRSLGEELLDAGGKRVGKTKRGVDGGRVAAGLDRSHELAADSRPAGKFSLGQATRQATLTDGGCAGHEPEC